MKVSVDVALLDDLELKLGDLAETMAQVNTAFEDRLHGLRQCQATEASNYQVAEVPREWVAWAAVEAESASAYLLKLNAQLARLRFDIRQVRKTAAPTPPKRAT